MNKIIKTKNIYLPALIVSNYLITTHLCNEDFPDDCIEYEYIYDLYERLTNLIINLLLIFYINKTRTSIKFNNIYIFFFFLTILSNIIFSYVSSIDMFKSSLNPQRDSNPNYNNKTTILYIVIFSTPVIVICYNFYKKTPKLKDVILRVIITSWYTIWSLLMYKYMGNIHLHHRLFSFIICLWSYQTKISTKILFFVSLGIFIQGSIVYPYTEMIDSVIEKEETVIPEPKVKEVYIYKCNFDYEEICEFCFS